MCWYFYRIIKSVICSAASKRNLDLFLFCPSCPCLFSNKNDYKVIPDGYSSLPLTCMEPESDKIRNTYLSIRTKHTKQALQLALVWGHLEITSLENRGIPHCIAQFTGYFWIGVLDCKEKKQRLHLYLKFKQHRRSKKHTNLNEEWRRARRRKTLAGAKVNTLIKWPHLSFEQTKLDKLWCDTVVTVYCVSVRVPRGNKEF